MIEAGIFDMDGLLIDSEPHWRKSHQAVLARYGHRFTEDDVRGKPFPDVFLSTARSLKVAPENCLVVEDSLNGVKAAKAALMYCFAVPEDPYDRALFEQAQADRIFRSLGDITWQDIASID